MAQWFYLMTSAFSNTQTTAVGDALTSSATTVLDTFIDLLPIIALIVGVIFGINFVNGKFRKLEKKR